MSDQDALASMGASAIVPEMGSLSAMRWVPDGQSHDGILQGPHMFLDLAVPRGVVSLRGRWCQ